MATNLILGLILHFVGDYLLQNDWMAKNKTISNMAAFVHAWVYGLPFFLLGLNDYVVWIIFISHYFIDRYQLAVYWVKLINWNWESSNFGFSEDKPKWLSTWLLIVTDNIWHIIINSIAIYYFTI